jgi:hypothetical protein
VAGGERRAVHLVGEQASMVRGCAAARWVRVVATPTTRRGRPRPRPRSAGPGSWPAPQASRRCRRRPHRARSAAPGSPWAT